MKKNCFFLKKKKRTVITKHANRILKKFEIDGTMPPPIVWNNTKLFGLNTAHLYRELITLTETNSRDTKEKSCAFHCLISTMDSSSFSDLAAKAGVMRTCSMMTNLINWEID